MRYSRTGPGNELLSAKEETSTLDLLARRWRGRIFERWVERGFLIQNVIGI